MINNNNITSTNLLKMHLKHKRSIAYKDNIRIKRLNKAEFGTAYYKSIVDGVVYLIVKWDNSKRISRILEKSVVFVNV